MESIIQWLFLFILALTGFLISRGLLSKKTDGGEAMATGPMPDIEGVLRQILERTTKLEGVSVQQMSPEVAALAETQVQSLKKELASRDEEVKALKASGGGGGVPEEAAKLTTRLKELESKLAEYEILEDDIADLSLYKEENTRLRSELDKMKGGGTPINAAPAAGEPLPAIMENPSSPTLDGPAAAQSSADDIVAEFAHAVNAEAVADGPDVTMQVPDTGNPMKDFEAAVKIEKKMAGVAPPTAAAPGATASAPSGSAPQSGAIASAPPPPKNTGPKGESDDLFAEFSESPDPGADDGGLDTDKMMAEMAALVSLDPASGSSLEEGIDTDKMAAEAGSFQKR